MTALARALAQESPLLILDEPTAALTDAETHGAVRCHPPTSARGVAILYVSHRLEEVLRIADRYTILRNGRLVAPGRHRATRPSRRSSRPWPAGPSTRSSRPGQSERRDGRAGGRRARAADGSATCRSSCAPARSWASPVWRVPDAASCCAIIGGSHVIEHRAGCALDGRPLRARAARPRRTARAWCWCPRSDGHRRSRRTPSNATSTRPRSTPQACASVVVSRARERAHAQGLWEAFGVRGHGARPGGPDAVRRQSAEGRARQVPGAAAAGAAAGRADPRRGRVHEEPDLPASSASGCMRAAPSSWSAPSCPRCIGLCDRIVVLHEGGSPAVRPRHRDRGAAPPRLLRARRRERQTSSPAWTDHDSDLTASTHALRQTGRSASGRSWDPWPCWSSSRIFGMLYPTTFLSRENLLVNVLDTVSFLVIVAAAQTIVMVVGDFDLSVGGLAALATSFTAAILTTTTLSRGSPSDPGSVPLAIGIGLVVGARLRPRQRRARVLPRRHGLHRHAGHVGGVHEPRPLPRRREARLRARRAGLRRGRPRPDPGSLQQGLDRDGSSLAPSGSCSTARRSAAGCTRSAATPRRRATRASTPAWSASWRSRCAASGPRRRASSRPPAPRPRTRPRPQNWMLQSIAGVFLGMAMFRGGRPEPAGHGARCHPPAGDRQRAQLHGHQRLHPERHLGASSSSSPCCRRRIAGCARLAEPDSQRDHDDRARRLPAHTW